MTYVAQAGEPVLVKVTQTEVTVRTLAELVEEIMGPDAGLL